MRAGGAVAFLFALAAPISLAVGAAPALAQDGPGAPRVAPEVATAAPGTSVLVDLDGWARYATLTVALCGNDGRRGSQDCDLIGAQSVEARTAHEVVRLPVTVPPMPCPCAIRAYDLTGTVDVRAPFVVTGVPVAETVGPDPAKVVPLTVRASLHRRGASLGSTFRQALAGPSEWVLALDIRNTTTSPLDDVVVSATLGRHRGSGAVLDVPRGFALQPGQVRRVEVPVHLDAPSRGTYVVSGHAFSAGQRVPFAASASTTPWLLELLALVLLVDLVALVVLARARRQPREVAAGEPDGTTDDGSANSRETVPLGRFAATRPFLGSPTC